MPVPVFRSAILRSAVSRTPRLAITRLAITRLASALMTARLMSLMRAACAHPAARLRFAHCLPVLITVALAGCSLPIPPGDPASRAQITPAQNCAIAYDLARLIHRNISLRETVIIAPRRGNPCETRALHYLRLSGFAVDEAARATRGRRNQPGFDVALTPTGDGIIEAVATVAGTLHIARRYRLAETGVYPVSAPSIGALSAPYQRRAISGRRHPDPYAVPWSGGDVR